MAGSDRELHAIEFRIQRYRNGRGAFAPLVKDLDAYTNQIDDRSSFKVELRSKWLDLDEINGAIQRIGIAEPQSEHRRIAEIVLDELIEIARTHRDAAPLPRRRRG